MGASADPSEKVLSSPQEANRNEGDISEHITVPSCGSYAVTSETEGNHYPTNAEEQTYQPEGGEDNTVSHNSFTGETPSVNEKNMQYVIPGSNTDWTFSAYTRQMESDTTAPRDNDIATTFGDSHISAWADWIMQGTDAPTTTKKDSLSYAEKEGLRRQNAKSHVVFLNH